MFHSVNTDGSKSDEVQGLIGGLSTNPQKGLFISPFICQLLPTWALKLNTVSSSVLFLCFFLQWLIDPFKPKAVQRLMWLKFSSGQPLSSVQNRSASVGNGPFGASSLRYRCFARVDRLFLLIKKRPEISSRWSWDVSLSIKIRGCDATRCGDPAWPLIQVCVW